MIVLRTKSYADSLQDNQNIQPQAQQPQGEQLLTSKELLLEQMKQQRQLMQTQRLRQKIQAQEARDRFKALQNAQKADREEKMDDAKNVIKAKQLENQSNSAEAKNVSLYKTRSKVVAPVSMK